MVENSWDTWEELLLGAAVLRHGHRHWNLVAADLRLRIFRIYPCTPQVCKAKYEDLQKRFVGCKALNEELRRQRIMELRQSLEQSEDSIRSLESKLEALKSSSEDMTLTNSSSKTQSWGAVYKPTNYLSADRFTQENRTCSSSECQAASVSSEEMEIKIEASQPQSLKRDGSILSIENLGGILYESLGGTVRKKPRGKRKRKDYNRNFKEGSSGENNFSESASTVCHSIENSCCNSFEPREFFDANEAPTIDQVDVLMDAINFVMDNNNTSVFRCRLDSQERARYKKLIRQHLDIETIRSRVASHCITTQKELYRDLLLLANNAIVFYSSNSRKHQSAVLLRGLITSTFQKLLSKNSNKGKGVVETSKTEQSAASDIRRRKRGRTK